jgi:flagellar protein FliO/FliZ
MAFEYFQVFLAFLFVLGLIGIMSYVLRKFSFESIILKNNPAKEKRLGIVEILPIDTKRRLLLVKNGKKNHLLLLGINGDILVESYDE